MATDIQPRQAVPDMNPNASAQPTPSGEAKKAKERDPYFSNAKLALIVLVVCGHAWAQLIGNNDVIRGLYYTLYNFHMPAFILICGYFSKSFVARPDQLQRLLSGVLAPYLIFSALYGVMRALNEDGFGLSLFYPYYLLWFLVALFLWRLSAPLWRAIKYPVVVATVIGVGAIVLELPSVLDLGRVLQFLPFFVAGMFLTRDHFAVMKRPLVKYGSLLLSVGIVVAAVRISPELNSNWIYYNEGATQMNTAQTEALGIKLMLMASAVVLLVTFFSWIPDMKLRISRLGEFTMYTFLLHGFFVKVADAHGVFAIEQVGTPLGIAAVTVTSIVLAFVLLSKPVRWVTRPFVEPNLNWLFARRSPRPAAQQVSG